jgi:phytoene dehydrogenase-like protein
MAQPRDVVILGAGRNGLVTAFYLAKAGFKPLILERRPSVGGCAITEEFHPGFRCSRLAHGAGPMRSDIVRGMELEKHGLKTYTPDVRVLSLWGDGKPLVLHSDVARRSKRSPSFHKRTPRSTLNFRNPWPASTKLPIF